MAPSANEYDSLAKQAESLNIQTERFNLSEVKEKPKTLCQQRWGLEDDTGCDTYFGAAIAKAAQRLNTENIILLPVSNLLLDAHEIAQSLKLHLSEGFDLLLSQERITGANWAIFKTELLRALYKQHTDIMLARGGLAWAVLKPLYPFNIGKWHCPRVKPRLNVDLRLNSERTLYLYKKLADENFVSENFSYRQWLQNSGYEELYCDFAPLSINLELTNKCSANCCLCPSPSLKRPKTEMPLEAFEKIAVQIKPQSDCSWVFSGLGEPMLHKDIAKIIKMAGLHSHVSLYTSLMPYPPKELDYKYIDLLRISVDATSMQMYSRLRAGCDWQNVAEFLGLAKQIKAENPNEFCEIGVSMLQNAQTDEYTTDFVKHYSAICTPPYKQWFFRWPFDSAPQPVQWYQIIGESEFMRPNTRTSKINFEPVKRRPCRRALLTLNITCSGKASYCSADAEQTTFLGDAFKSSIDEIWHSKLAKEFRKAHLSLQFNPDSPCKSCKEWYRAE